MSKVTLFVAKTFDLSNETGDKLNATFDMSPFDLSPVWMGFKHVDASAADVSFRR